MKKYIGIMLVFIISLALFCGCAKGSTNLASEPKWERNTEEHWKIDENGNKTELGKHELGNNNICAVCGSFIISTEDGYSSINNYDENGNMTSCTVVDPDGTVYEYIYEYPENSESFFCKTYKNGELFMEDEYPVDSNGNQISISYVMYSEDGSKIEAECNEYGETAKAYEYSPEGELLSEIIYEYSYSDDGTRYCSFDSCTNYQEIRIFEHHYNEFGDEISYTQYRLDNRNIISEEEYEYEYDEEGRKIYKKTLEHKSMREEFFYENCENEEGPYSYCSKYIYHNQTGYYTVYEYNELGETISETNYDTFGNKIP